MLNGLPILIVEDEPVVALDMATAVEELAGCAIGPVPTVSEALLLLQTTTISAAILDANLLDGPITPVVLVLTQSAIPFVIHTGTGLPPELESLIPNVPVIMKPAAVTAVLATLLQQVSPDRSLFEKKTP